MRWQLLDLKSARPVTFDVIALAGDTNEVDMWIQVRSMDGRKNVRVDNLSKLTTIDQLRERLVKEFDAEPSRQRLFYRGKQVRTLYASIRYYAIC